MQRSLTLMFLLLMHFVRLAHAADGDLDLSFGVNGVATVGIVTGDTVDQTAAMTRDVDLGGDEWIYLCGTSEGAAAVLKISAETGALDPTYGNAGVANFYDSEELATLGFGYTIFDCAVDTTSHALYLVGRGKTLVNVTNYDFCDEIDRGWRPGYKFW